MLLGYGDPWLWADSLWLVENQLMVERQWGAEHGAFSDCIRTKFGNPGVLLQIIIDEIMCTRRTKFVRHILIEYTYTALGPSQDNRGVEHRQ
jgi:hypothetical protein